MLGTITRVFVEVLRKGRIIPAEDILGRVVPHTVLLNNDYDAVVNCNLPFIGVFVTSATSTTNSYIGNDYLGFNCTIQIVILTPFDNPAASSDSDIQYEYIDLSGKVLAHLAKADKEGGFKELEEKYGFSFSYQGIDADQPRYKTQKQNYEVVQHTLVYAGKGLLLDLNDDLNKEAPIKEIDTHCEFYLVPAGELPPQDPNNSRTYDHKKPEATF